MGLGCPRAAMGSSLDGYEAFRVCITGKVVSYVMLLECNPPFKLFECHIPSPGSY